MKLLKILFLPLILNVFTPTISYAGKETGGDFEFYYTDVDEVIRESQKLAIKTITHWPERVWEHPYFSKPINRSELISIIQNSRFNKTKEVSRNDPGGQEEPLLMNYGRDPEGYIEILRPYFQELKTRLQFYEDIQAIEADVSKSLLHEALHLFDYSEAEAERASRFVYGYEAVVNCDQSEAQFVGYKCLYVTSNRTGQVTSLLASWLKLKRTQPYSLIISNPDSGISIQFDLSSPIDLKKSFRIANNKGGFEPKKCDAADSIVRCEFHGTFVLFDLYNSLSIANLNITGDLEQFLDSESRKIGGLRHYVRKLFQNTKPSVILIKRMP